MVMLDVDDIVRQVLQNCNISDARHAGLYSLCGLALRLRDLYKWEKGLEPWAEEESARVLEWIGEKEEKWECLAETEYEKIRILGKLYDPFDSAGINSALEASGFFYGAGYVHSLRPTFFMGSLEEERRIDGVPVYILGRELARDMLTLPALSQGESILIRKDSARAFLWDEIFFIRKSGQEALEFALNHHGLKYPDLEALKQNLSRIVGAEVDTYIYHELGGLKDSEFDGDIWRGIISSFPHSSVELFARAVKDLLADTTEKGTLPYIVRKRRPASLGFHVAFLDGLRKRLFPEIIDGFREYKRSGDWGVVEEAIRRGYGRGKGFAEEMSHIFCEARDSGEIRRAEGEIEKKMLAPLGIGIKAQS